MCDGKGWLRRGVQGDIARAAGIAGTFRARAGGEGDGLVVVAVVLPATRDIRCG